VIVDYYKKIIFRFKPMLIKFYV